MLKPAQRHAERALALVTALAVVLVGFASAPLAYAADTFEGRDLLYRRHVDAAHISWEGDEKDGHFTVKVVDGSRPRPADEVFVRLGPDADTRGIETSRIKVPHRKDLAFLGKPGDVIWASPQDYIYGWSPVWAGFGASHDIPEKFFPESVKLELIASGGPGDVEVYNTNKGELADRLFSSKDKQFSIFPMEPGAHAHTNWAFTKPGRYDTKWRVHAKTREGKEVTSDVQTVTWLVGTDEELGIPAGTYKGARITTPAEQFDIGNPPAEEDSPNTPQPFDPLAFNPTKELPKCTHVSEGHLDLRTKMGDDGWLAAFMRQDLPGGKQVDHGSSSVVIEVPDKAKVKVGKDKRFAKLASAVGTGEKWELPEVQKAGIPWPGFSTEDLDYTNNKDTKVKLESFEGPAGASFALGHYDSLTGTYEVDLQSRDQNQVWRINEPTHVHPSLVFSHPGFYQVEYTISYEKTTGERNYDFYTVFYAVGSKAIANSCERENAETPVATSPAEPIQPNPAPAPEPAPVEPTPATPVEEPAKPVTEPANPENPNEDSATERLVFDHGHMDAFNVDVQDGKLRLTLKEDVTGSHVLRAPETVELHVKSAAKMDIPTGFPGEGKDRFFLPQTQDHNLLWPGWDTLSTGGTGFAPGIDIEFTEVSGPGQIFLFGTGFTGMTPLLKDGATELKTGAVREQTFPAHTHANWVFTKPGVYTVKVRAVGAKDGQREVSNEAVYTWTVGDEFRGKGYVAPAKPEEETPAPADPVTEPTTPAEPTAPAEPETSAEPATPAEPTTPAEPETPAEPVEEPTQPGEPAEEPATHAEPTAPAKPAEDPTKPAEPADGAPVIPVKPSQPATPEGAAQPETPATPEKEEAPAPEKSPVSASPTKEGKQVKAQEVDKAKKAPRADTSAPEKSPSLSQGGDSSDAARTKLPRTGSDAAVPLGVALMLLAGGSGALLLRRRFQQQDSQRDNS
ncbi:choice-of-anchor M domain-containing protein [Dermabacteraceae bacterium TAE3-ERU27]|nr:choice-of-anchor M domain-containing protein [Dermabacteraceae bacterium TAE3-ERU27]